MLGTSFTGALRQFGRAPATTALNLFALAGRAAIIGLRDHLICQPFLDIFSQSMENTIHGFFQKNRIKLRTNTGFGLR